MDNAKVDSPFQQIESHLVSSLQEVIRLSIDSFRSTIKSQVRIQISALTEKDKTDSTPGATSQGLTGQQPDSNPPTSSEVSSILFLLFYEEKGKERSKVNVIVHGMHSQK